MQGLKNSVYNKYFLLNIQFYEGYRFVVALAGILLGRLSDSKLPLRQMG
ncbi:hypothetical protein JCM39194_14560 [Desulfotomaculum varum]